MKTGNNRQHGVKQRIMASPLLCLVAGFAGSLLLSVQALAEPVNLRAWDHDTYGRIVFEWPSNTGFSAEIQGDELVLNFTNSMEADFAPVLSNLSRYIASADIGSSGQTAILRLKGPFDLKSFAAGRNVVVDLVDRPDSFTAATAAAPAAAQNADTASQPTATATAPSAVAQPSDTASFEQTASGPAVSAALGDLDTILVRTGRHPTYERIVFDWRRSVDYDVTQDGNQVNIRFKEKARPDFSQFDRGRVVMIGAPAASLDGDDLLVAFNVPDGVRLRNQKVGTKVVVDVLGDANSQAVRDFAANKDTPPALQGAVTEPATVIAEEPVTDTEAVAAEDGPRQLVPDDDETEAETAEATEESVTEDTPAPLTEEVVSPEESIAEGDTYGPVPDDLQADQSFRVELDLVPGGVQAIFTWEQPVLATVFQRSGYTWITFNEEARAVMPQATRELVPFVRRMEQVTAERNVGTALRLAVRSDLFPTVAREDKIWRVTFRADGGSPASNIQVVSDPLGRDGARVVLPNKEVANRVDFVDPEVGDRIETVPVGIPGQGIANRREFVEFSVLPTVQGIAISPRTDDLNVQPGATGVEISTEGGLFLSRIEGEDLELLQGDKFPAIEGDFYRYRTWMRSREEDFDRERHALLAELARVPERVKNEARMDLARFFFAHDLPEYAIGYLRMIEESDETKALEAEFRGIQGAVLHQLNRSEDALRILEQRNLDDNEEVALFRGLANAAVGKWDRALENLQAAEAVIDTFPQEHRIDARLTLAEASLNMFDPQAVEPLIKLVKGETIPPRDSQLAWADYLNGLGMTRRDKKFRGMELLEVLASGDDRRAAAFSRFHHIVLQEEDEAITTEEAIDRLESLKYSWRGGDYELNLLDKLADLYFKQGQYREGLVTLQDAVGTFPGLDRTKEMAGRMNAVFADLFLNDGADQLSPVKALALYQDFQELVPLGRDGDVMTRKLANRMVGVDLLDQAARLLRSQIDFRLKGQERSEAGAELALIHLLNRDPESALRALSATELDDLPERLVQQRNYFRVQAMKDMQRFDTALELLGTDNSYESSQLRADIYWQSQDWVNSVRSLNTLLDNAWRTDFPLTDDQRKMVLQMAIALNLARNRDGLELLRSRYEPKMMGSPDEDRFRTHTEVIDPSQLEYRDLSSKIAGIGQLEAFMKDFREKLQQGGLDAITGKQAEEAPAADEPVAEAPADAPAEETANTN